MRRSFGLAVSACVAGAFLAGSPASSTTLHNGLTYYDFFTEFPSNKNVETLGDTFELNLHLPVNATWFRFWSMQINGDIAVSGQNWTVPTFAYRSSNSSFTHGTAIKEFQVDDTYYLHTLIDTSVPSSVLDKRILSADFDVYVYVDYFVGDRWFTHQKQLTLTYFGDPPDPSVVPLPPSAALLLLALASFLGRTRRSVFSFFLRRLVT